MKNKNWKLISGSLVVRSMVIFIGFCFLILAPAQVKAFSTTMPTVLDPGYKIQVLVPGCHFTGLNGLAFDSQDTLYGGTVAGLATFRINKETGETMMFLPPPTGGADDLIFEPGGRVIWNAFFLGKVFAKGADGKTVTLADNMPGANSIAASKDGRVFVSQVFLGDALWEMDLSGQQKNRKIAEKLGGLNAFRVGADGYIYGPLWFKGQVAKVDVNSGKVEIVADGFKVPAAAKFDSKGNLFVLDTATGEVVQVDIKTGKKKVVAQLESHLDNLAIDSKDRMFVSNMGNNSLYEVDVKTGKVRTVIEGKLACPQGIAVSTDPDGDTLYVADNFTYKRIDGFTGSVKDPNKGAAFPNTASIHGDTVLMSGWFTNAVQVFDRKTDNLLYVIKGFKTPTGTLMLDDGSILVAEVGTGSILRVQDKEGKQRTPIAKDLAVPTYLAKAGPGAVYVTEFGAGRVTKVDLKTGNKKVIATGFSAPKGIAVKPDGKILVVDTGTRQLIQIDPATGESKPLVINLAVGLPVPSGFMPAYMLTGVAVSDSGAIYVTSDVENAVYKISPK